MIFWIITTAMAVLVAAMLILAMRRPQGGDASGDDAAERSDLQVYREQLREVERDLARGVVSESDAERVRVEVSRRILAADARGRDTGTGPQASGSARGVALVLAVLIIAGSGALYLGLGTPGYGDLGLKQRITTARQLYETRMSQAEAVAQVTPAPPVELDPEYKALIEQLRVKAAEQPDDLQGQLLLAHHEARSGNLDAALAAQARVIDLMGDKVGAEEYAQYGELLIVAANGYVSPEAEAALRKALELDPRHGPAGYYWGLMLAQTGRPDLAFRIWERTLRQGPDDAPWLVPIRESIEEMAWRAGAVNFEMPDKRRRAPPLAGPTDEDVNAAADMSAEDRQAMIRSMVARLSDRLATEGGSPEEWARLIGALGVLGDGDRAKAIFGEARQVFAGNDAALSTLGEAAARAGLGE